MTLLHIEGFEHEDVNAARTTISVLQTDLIAGASRSGSGNVYLRCSTFDEWYTVITAMDADDNEIHCGFAMRAEGPLAATAGVVILSGVQTGGSISADSSCLQLAYTSDGTPSLHIKGDGNDVDDSSFRIGSPITGSAGDIQADTWHYIEFRWLPHASAGQIELWIDGVSIGSQSGVDTYGNTATTAIRDVWMVFSGQNSGDLSWWDDIYILDDSTTSPEGGTSPNITRLGDIVIEAIVPTSDNIPEDWALQAGGDSFAMVDEIPHDTDTTYIQSSTVTDETRLDLASRTHTGTVVGVQTQVVARKTSGNARTMDFGIVSNAGATKESVPPEVTLAESYDHFQKLYDRDPVDEVTAADWDTTKVNALEVFVEVAS